MKIRSYIAPLLLLLISGTPLFFTIGWQVKQQVIRHRMKESLENTLLHHLTLTPEEMTWIEPGKELLINGQLFDVKEMNQAGNGSWEVTGLFDQEETQLVDLIQKKLPDENGHQLIGKLFRWQLTIPDPLSDLPGCILPHHLNKDGYLPNRLLQSSLDILAPPPKTVL